MVVTFHSNIRENNYCTLYKDRYLVPNVSLLSAFDGALGPGNEVNKDRFVEGKVP